MELNNLHPYREGNGHTQRIFAEALVRQAGHALHFDVVSKERMIRASILSAAGDSTMMIRLFQEITNPERIQPLRRAIEFLAANRFPWNTTYLATATPGQKYAGKLVGREGAAFMMRTDLDQIIAGQQADIPTEIRSGEQLSFTAREATAPDLRGGVSRSDVARDAVEYMRRSNTAIANMPIAEQTTPETGTVTGIAVADRDTHLAVATAPNSFVVIEKPTGAGAVELGKRVRVRFNRGHSIIKLAHDRGRYRWFLVHFHR